MLPICEPTLLIDESKVEANIQGLINKIPDVSLFRPHFKTHQSRAIGQIFKRNGIDKICVSSLKMAQYFFEDGWTDITIAFPFNPAQIKPLNQFITHCRVQLVVESMEVIQFLAQHLQHSVDIMIKIDAGYGRAGISYQNSNQVIDMATYCQNADYLVFKGLLAHFGNTYQAINKNEVLDIYSISLARLRSIQHQLSQHQLDALISIGDTPSSSCLDELDPNVEYRPGNFVYYDLMQASKEYCAYDDIACVVACPIVAIHHLSNECIIHGGAIHFSKEYNINKDGNKTYGMLAHIHSDGSWTGLHENVSLVKISQEHGVIKGEPSWIAQRKVGEWLYVYPIHSCLTVHAMREAKNVKGKSLDIM